MRIFYRPKIQFMTDKEKPIEVLSSIASSSPKYYEGQEINVTYDPINPEDCKIDSWATKWLGSTIFFTFGGGCLFAAIIIYLMEARLMHLLFK